MCLSEMAIMNYVTEWAMERPLKFDKNKGITLAVPPRLSRPPVPVPPTTPMVGPLTKRRRLPDLAGNVLESTKNSTGARLSQLVANDPRPGCEGSQGRETLVGACVCCSAAQLRMVQRDKMKQHVAADQDTVMQLALLGNGLGRFGE